jgi:hypothetical protein
MDFLGSAAYLYAARLRVRAHFIYSNAKLKFLHNHKLIRRK